MRYKVLVSIKTKFSATYSCAERVSVDFKLEKNYLIININVRLICLINIFFKLNMCTKRVLKIGLKITLKEMIRFKIKC